MKYLLSFGSVRRGGIKLNTDRVESGFDSVLINSSISIFYNVFKDLQQPMVKVTIFFVARIRAFELRMRCRG